MDIEFNKEIIKWAAIDFAQHIDLDKNVNILFSGKYGKGKSTFLDYFFQNCKGHGTKVNYQPFILDPTHYSIASNEDILKYIKYDLVLSLAEQIAFDEVEIEIKDAATHYLKENIAEVCLDLLAFIPKVGKMIQDVGKAIQNIYDGVKKTKKYLYDASDSQRLLGFLKNIKGDSKNYFESDVITTLIQKYIERCSDKNNTTPVLIIDNLDRLDPDHIFRILNIFSAHFPLSSTNKFHFEKVVLVCDVNNIKSIFQHKYGSEADFKGYIDKFYSHSIFHFDISEYLPDFINDKLNSLLRIKCYGQIKPYDQVQKNNYRLSEFITIFIEYDHLTLRQFKHALKEEISFKYKFNSEEFFPDSPYLDLIIMTKLLGGFENTIKVFESLKNIKAMFDNFEYVIKQFLMYFMARSHRYKTMYETSRTNLHIPEISTSAIAISYEYNGDNNFVCDFNGTYSPRVEDLYAIILIHLKRLNTNRLLPN